MWDDCVHAEIGEVFIVLVMGLNGWGNDINHVRVFFREFGGEVHFFPSVLFLFADSREAKFGADAFAFDEVDVAILLIIKNYWRGACICTLGVIWLRIFQSRTCGSRDQYSSRYVRTNPPWAIAWPSRNIEFAHSVDCAIRVLRSCLRTVPFMRVKADSWI